MKTRNLILLVLCSVAVLLSCDSEQITEETQANLETTIVDQPKEGDDSSQQRWEGFFPCTETIECDPDYTFDTLPFSESNNYRMIYIQYDESVSELNVICLRQNFFECFPELRMNILQMTDVHRDLWRYPYDDSDLQPKTNKVLDGSIDDDPRMTCTSC